MKARNGSMQDKARWDSILGSMRISSPNFPTSSNLSDGQSGLSDGQSGLSDGRRQAHYSGSPEFSVRLKELCSRVSEEIHHSRHMLGTVARA